MEYRRITEETKDDLQLPNEPFELFGRLLVTRKNNQWSYESELFQEVDQMTFPNEAYDFDQIKKEGFALGA